MYVARLYAGASLKRTRQARLTEPGWKGSGFSRMDHGKGQSGPTRHLHAHWKPGRRPLGFPLQVPSMQNKWTGRNKGWLLSLCIKTQRSETNGLYLFFLHYIHALLICHFMYSPKGGKQQRCRRIRVKSSILITVDEKKKKAKKKMWGEKEMRELLSKQTTSICFTSKEQQI